MKKRIIDLVVIFVMSLVLNCCINSPKDDINNEIIDQSCESLAIYGGNIERTGVFNTKPPSKEFKVKWKVKINHGTQEEHLRFYDRPVAADSTVYIASGILHAIDINSGTELWSISGKSLEHPIIYKDTEIYAISTTLDPKHLILYRISSSGNIVWEKLLPFSYLTPEIIINNDILYIGFEGFEPFIFALDVYSGEEVWTYKDNELTSLTGPALSNGILYFFASTKKSAYLIAIDARGGELLYSRAIPADTSNLPAISNGKIYFGDSKSTFYCLDAKTGKEIWTFKLEQKISYMQNFGVSTSPVVWNNYLYFKTFDRFLYCLDATNGKELWNVKLKETVFSAPAFCNGVLYVAEGDYMTSFNPLTGERIWEVEIGPIGWSSPYIFDGKIFIGCDDGYLYCLE